MERHKTMDYGVGRKGTTDTDFIMTSIYLRRGKDRKGGKRDRG